jgi:hypothetical protein
MREIIVTIYLMGGRIEGHIGHCGHRLALWKEVGQVVKIGLDEYVYIEINHTIQFPRQEFGQQPTPVKRTWITLASLLIGTQPAESCFGKRRWLIGFA